MGVVASAHGRIEVDPDVLINAGKRVESLGSQLAMLSDSLGAALGGGIASGADSAGLSFGLQYGRIADDFAKTLAMAANSYLGVGRMLQATGYNYRNADAASTIGGQGASGGVGPAPAEKVAADLPTGPNGVMVPPPSKWYLVEPLLQVLPGLGLIAGTAMSWPSGNAAMMNVLAAQWRNFSTGFAIFQSELNALKPAVAAQHIPEGDKISEAFDNLGTAMSHLTDTATTTAQKISDFAKEVQQVQDAIRRLLDRLSLSGLWDTVTDFFTGDGMKVLREVARDVSTVLGNFQRQVEGIVGLLNELKNVISDAADAFQKWIRPVLVAQFGDDVGNFLADAVTLYTDFEVGLANGLINTVSGVVSMADPATWKGMAEKAWEVANDPSKAPGVLAEMGKQFIALDQWKGDHPGRGAGEAAFNIGSLFVPGGALSKTGSVAKSLNMTRRVLEEGRLPKLGEIGEWSRGAPKFDGVGDLPGGQGVPDVPEVRPGAVPDSLVGPTAPHGIDAPTTPRGLDSPHGPAGPPDPPGPQSTPGGTHQGGGANPPPDPPGRSVPPSPADSGPGRVDGSAPQPPGPPSHTPGPTSHTPEQSPSAPEASPRAPEASPPAASPPHETHSPAGTPETPRAPEPGSHAPEAGSHAPEAGSRTTEIRETSTPGGNEPPTASHPPVEHQPTVDQPRVHEPAAHQPSTHESVDTSPASTPTGQHPTAPTPMVGGMPMGPHVAGPMHAAGDHSPAARTPAPDASTRTPEARSPEGRSPDTRSPQTNSPSPTGAGPSAERSPSAPVKASATPPESAPAREQLRPTQDAPAARAEDHSAPHRDETPTTAEHHPTEPAGSSHDPGAGTGPEHADHSGPVGNPANDRIYGPGQLDHVEDPAYQRAVEDALRDPQGNYVRHADPRTNDYGNLINDGGPTVDGRSNNCLDCSLSALSSFRGEPTVSAPRYLDELPDGTIDRESGERNGLNRAQNWLGDGLLEFPDHGLSDQFDLLHRYINQLGPGSAALVVNGWHARDLITGEYLFDAHGMPITSGSHATVIVHPEGGGGPVWWDPQQGLTSDRPPAWMVEQSTYLHFTPIEPSQGVHHAGIGHQGTGAGVSGRDGSEPDLSRATVSVRMDGDESAFPGADGGGPGSGTGEAGDRFGDGDRVSVPELVGDDGGRGVHDVQGDGTQPGRESDLSTPVGDQDSTYAGGHNDDRISVDGGVSEQSPRADAGSPADNREAHGSVRPEGSAVESGGVTREVGEPSESGRVAGDGYHVPVGEHNDGGAGHQGAGIGVSGADVTNRDIPSAPNPEGLGGDQSAFSGTDGLGSSSRLGPAGDRFGDGDHLSVPELVGDDGGRGVHDVQGDGVQPGREPDLPASVTDHDLAGTGGRADHRLSDDGGVADRSPGTHPAESPGHREADSGSRAERVAGERGDVARGVAEPTEPRGVAGGGDNRGVGGGRAGLAADIPHQLDEGRHEPPLPHPAGDHSEQPSGHERDYDLTGHTIPTDQLVHPAAGLLDEGLLDAAAANPTRVNDALSPGAPSSHPEVRALVPNDYDPKGGLSEEDWNREYWPSGNRDRHGNPDLTWPDPQHHPQGFSTPEARTPAVLQPGEMFDRFGPGFGQFGSPVGTEFPLRALPPHSLDAGYHRYEVIRPIPLWEGPIAPAMGQPGGGVQYYFTRPIVDLLNAGYLREVAL
ncbi:glycohydrolase toxin TNT-related protein [Mycolicibacterium sp. 120266]|uniref:glycohydrolase toxin TNT-related protein n=1 Tax=Mycolicibacterium sp. 120266 TaxID=3090601 RepID=UPI00299DC7A8|nr:glycohydrolase toxin TNT-related protein [Mycolicibacterium sp. 120266]MDX1874325.1 glycohydrolase toxin TNT-related protein [Mycolicibacterium sp. 120266]